MKKILILLVVSPIILLAQNTSPLKPSLFDVDGTKPLYILDGKVIKDPKSVDPNSIETITVMKGSAETVAKYGDTAKKGVVVMVSKPGAIDRGSIDPRATQIWEMTPTVITAGKNVGDAPSDAIVLFDGTDLSKWASGSDGEAKWEVKDGAMTVVPGTGAIKTKQAFGDIQLHIEWRTPALVKGDGQNRGNSGIFFQEDYELQVLDSYDNPTYANGQAGAIYKQYIPLVNVSRKPGEWQTYDVVFTAPRFSDNGRVILPAYITVFQNGVVVQNHVQINGPTENQGLPLYKAHGNRSMILQDHGTQVSYRNIWLREL